MTNVTIPANVTSIGTHTFYECKSLASITIPASVTTIGDSAFYECTGLGNVTFLGNAPPKAIENTAFAWLASSGVIYYPENGSGYNTAWKDSLRWDDNWTLVAVPLPVLTAGTVSRTSTSATVRFTSDTAGQYYYAVAASGGARPTIDTSSTGTACSTGENTINLTGLTVGAQGIYIIVKDETGYISINTFYISIPAYVPPVLTVTPVALSLENVTSGNSSTKTVMISGTDLTDSISCQLKDTSGAFSLGTSDWNVGGGGTLEVTFEPPAAADYSATLIVSSTGAEDVTVALTGTGVSGGGTTEPVPVYYTIDFYNGDELYATHTANEGNSLITWPPAPIRENYIFGGWYTGKDGTGTQYISTSPIYSQLSLYAKWSYNEVASSTPGSGASTPSIRPGSSPREDNNSNSMPQTGDSPFPGVLWMIGILILSATGILFFFVFRRIHIQR